jgi:hypothetical protein
MSACRQLIIPSTLGVPASIQGVATSAISPPHNVGSTIFPQVTATGCCCLMETDSLSYRKPASQTDRQIDRQIDRQTDGKQVNTSQGADVYLLIQSVIHSFIHSFIHTFVHSFIHSFIESFIQSVSQSGRQAGRQAERYLHQCIGGFVEHIVRSVDSQGHLLDPPTLAKLLCVSVELQEACLCRQSTNAHRITPYCTVSTPAPYR